MKTAVIWRKSVYDTGECPSCGATLITEDMVPTNVIELDNRFYCSICGINVAILRPYYGDAKPGSKAGSWNELFSNPNVQNIEQEETDE